jgi:hypothetical protein
MRQRRVRRRRRLGLRMVHVEISEEAAEADERPVSRSDPITSAPRSAKPIDFVTLRNEIDTRSNKRVIALNGQRAKA